MRRVTTAFIIAAAVALPASPALAQSEISPKAAVSFVGGFGATTQTTGVALGASVLFDVNDRTALEAEGTYLDRGVGASALSASASLLVHVVPSRERIVPYAAVGGGLYRASFDLGRPGLMGPIGAQLAPGTTVCPAPGTGVGPGPGAGFGSGTGTCPATAAGYWGVGHMNDFYARRLGPMVVPSGAAWETRSFVDPAVSLGGGLRFNVNERLMVRPDVRALVVFGNGDTHALAIFGVKLGYRF